MRFLKTTLAGLAAVCAAVAPVHADQLSFLAAADATLHSEDAELANGSGEQMFAGRINGGDTEFRFKTYNGDIIIRRAGS